MSANRIDEPSIGCTVCSASRRRTATRCGSCATATRSFPAMLDAIEQAQRTVDFVTFVYWTGDIAVTFADGAPARGAAGMSGPRPARCGRGPQDRRVVDREDVESRVRRPVVPTVLRQEGAEDRRGQPSHPPQDPRLRQLDRVLRWRGHRGRSGPATPATKHEWRDTHLAVRGPAGRRAAERIPRQLGRPARGRIRRASRARRRLHRARLDGDVRRPRLVRDRGERRLADDHDARVDGGEAAPRSRRPTSTPTGS